MQANSERERLQGLLAHKSSAAGGESAEQLRARLAAAVEKHQALRYAGVLVLRCLGTPPRVVAERLEHLAAKESMRVYVHLNCDVVQGEAG